MRNKIVTLAATLILYTGIQAQRPVLTLPVGHQSSIESIDYSRDGRLLATGSMDFSFIIWDIKTGFIVRSVKTSGAVQQVLFTPDATQLITVITESPEKTVVQKWDVKTGNLLQTFPFTASKGLQFLRYSGYLLVPDYSTGTGGGTPNILEMMQKASENSDEDEDAIDEKVEAKMKEKFGEEPDLSDPKKMAEYQKMAMDLTMQYRFGSNPLSKSTSLIDFKTLKPVATIKGAPGKIDLLYVNNKEYVLTQSSHIAEEVELELWDVIDLVNQYKLKKDPKPAKEFTVKGGINMLKGSAAKGFFAADAEQTSIRLLQMDKSAPVTSFAVKGSDLDGLEFSADGSILYVYSNSFPHRFIEAWNTSTFKQVIAMDLPDDYIGSYAGLSPSGDHFIVGNKRGFTKLSFSQDSIGNFTGTAGIGSEFGFTANDEQVYINYNDFPDIGKLVPQQPGDPDLSIFSKVVDKFRYNWDLMRGGAALHPDVIPPATLKIVSADGKYSLFNERIKSPAAQGKNVLDLLMNSPTDDMTEEEIKELNEAKKMMQSPEFKKIFADSTNGAVTNLVNRRTKDTISLISIGTSDWVMLLKNGYYMTSRNGARALSYTRGLDVFPFEQFDIQYNRPDLVLKAIGKADPELIDAYRKAYQQRIKNLKIDTLQFKADFNMPEADISNRKAIAYEQKGGKLTLTIAASDRKTNLDRYNVWVNEVPVFGKNGKSVANAKSNKLSTTIEINLSQGKNRIETSVINSSGVESFREPVFVNYTAASPVKEKVYFIGIGINRFADTTKNLQYCEKDIRDIAKRLKEKYGDALQTTLLINEEVTIDNIRALKQKLLESNEDDKVIIAYSGHGLLSEDYNYYLSTYAVNFKKPEENGLPYSELENLVDSIRARKKLMLLDACHSGEVDKEEMQKIAAVNKELKEKYNVVGKTRGVVPDEDGLGMQNSFELMQELFVNVGRGTGTMIIAAASGTQFALEIKGLENGAFTHSILGLLQGSKPVTINDLSKGVTEQVYKITQGLQRPVARDEINANNWVIW